MKYLKSIITKIRNQQNGNITAKQTMNDYYRSYSSEVEEGEEIKKYIDGFI
jgi:hypothetical protein